MLAGGCSRRRLTGVAALVALVALAGACGSDPDAQPSVASVDFTPRLVVSVDGDEITVQAGPRDGASPVHGDDPGYMTPAGSVVELTNDADGPRRVVVTTTPLFSTDAEPALWVDTGDLLPGESVVLGLSAEGDYHFALDGEEPSETVQVTPRPAS